MGHCFSRWRGLKEGNIIQLVETNAFRSVTGLPKRLLHDGLKALDYLESKGILHRDVKPENILWSLTGDVYLFQLTDFGLCNSISMASSFLGSRRYMAPEMLFPNGKVR